MHGGVMYSWWGLVYNIVLVVVGGGGAGVVVVVVFAVIVAVAAAVVVFGGGVLVVLVAVVIVVDVVAWIDSFQATVCASYSIAGPVRTGRWKEQSFSLLSPSRLLNFTNCVLQHQPISSSKSTRSPAAYCLSNDVSVWVAPAFIKSNVIWLDKGWGNPDRNVVAQTICCCKRVDLLDDYDFPARTITETNLFFFGRSPWTDCCHFFCFILSTNSCVIHSSDWVYPDNGRRVPGSAGVDIGGELKSDDDSAVHFDLCQQVHCNQRKCCAICICLPYLTLFDNYNVFLVIGPIDIEIPFPKTNSTALVFPYKSKNRKGEGYRRHFRSHLACCNAAVSDFRSDSGEADILGVNWIQFIDFGQKDKAH